MKISCPNCGQHYEIDESLIGESISCQKCKTIFVAADMSQHKETEGVFTKVAATVCTWLRTVISITKRNYEKELQKLKEQKQTITSELEEQWARLSSEQEALKQKITSLNETIDCGFKTLNSVQEDLALTSIAFYNPHYTYEKSIEFEREIAQVRLKQKNVLKENGALVEIPSGFPGKKSEMNALRKLMLRAFNAECELCMNNVDFKNVVQYETRIIKAREDINELAAKIIPGTLIITKEYTDLKIDELHLVYEFAVKKQQELEEQRRIKEIMRDEIRAEREMEKAKAEAEKEQAKYENLLQRAIEQAERANGEELDRMNAQIAILKQQLDDAKEKERKISEAQKTKAGYVYVISNIGSFGENVYKIGMTRRLEPQERIDELGDASVPFEFDVHALIWNENAPELENTLHKEFEKNRVNKINARKEFFRVSLEQIEQVAKKFKGDVQFTKLAEAREYRQSLAMETESSNVA